MLPRSIIILLTLLSHVDCKPSFKKSFIQKRDLVSGLSLDNDFVLRFATLGKKYSLTLERANSIFAPSFKIDGATNFATVDFRKEIKKGNLYKEKDGLGSYYIEVIDGEVRVTGIVDDRVRIWHDNGKHRALVINDENMTDAFKNDYLSVDSSGFISPASKNAIPELPRVVTIEVYALIDTALHKALMEKKLPVKKYLGIMWNFVQNKYKTTNNPMIQFAITAVKIIPRSDWITSTIVQNTTTPIVDSYKLLQNFSEWLHSKIGDKSNPRYDIAILHSGLDLASPTSVIGKFNRGNLGLAYLGGVCKIAGGQVLNTGVVEDLDPSSGYRNAFVLAHEVGHLLGASHDDDLPKEKYCPDDYIMYSRGSSNLISEFSNCSLEAFTEHLNKEESACVRNFATGNIPLLNPENPTGSLTPDRVCKNNFGNDATAVVREFHFKCLLLYCGKHKMDDDPEVVKPPDGMICGENKVCSNGKCRDK